MKTLIKTSFLIIIGVISIEAQAQFGATNGTNTNESLYDFEIRYINSPEPSELTDPQRSIDHHDNPPPERSSWDPARDAEGNGTDNGDGNDGFYYFNYYHVKITYDNQLVFEFKIGRNSIIIEERTDAASDYGIFLYLEESQATNTFSSFGMNHSFQFYKTIDRFSPSSQIMDIQDTLAAALANYHTLPDWENHIILADWEAEFANLTPCEQSILELIQSLHINGNYVSDLATRETLDQIVENQNLVKLDCFN